MNLLVKALYQQVNLFHAMMYFYSNGYLLLQNAYILHREFYLQKVKLDVPSINTGFVFCVRSLVVCG